MPDPVEVYKDGDTPWGCPDATIGGTTFVVEAFDPSRPTQKSVSKNGKGKPYRKVLVLDEITASMTIQFPTSETVPPARFAEFTYEGQKWVIESVGDTYGNEAEKKCNLTLSEVFNDEEDEEPEE